MITIEKQLIKRNTLENYDPFFSPDQYFEYINRTNEKYLLQSIIYSNYINDFLPIKKSDKNKKILDLGAGLGTNTTFLKRIFPEHEIWAIEPQKEFYDILTFEVTNKDRIVTQNIPFEDFTQKNFDFILVSHVLQYIDTSVLGFVKKIIEILNKNGEAWIILQEFSGINQIVESSINFLDNPSKYFLDWFVHNDLRRELYFNNINFKTQIFRSCFIPPNMMDIKDHDINLLNFILVDGFNKNNHYLVQSLSEVIADNVNNNCMLHEVGISKISK